MWVNEFEGVMFVFEVEVGMEKIWLGLVFVIVFRMLVWVICLVLLVVVVFFVFFIIKMVVYACSDEIEVLKLVGVTYCFI